MEISVLRLSLCVTLVLAMFGCGGGSKAADAPAKNPLLDTLHWKRNWEGKRKIGDIELRVAAQREPKNFVPTPQARSEESREGLSEEHAPASSRVVTLGLDDAQGKLVQIITSVDDTAPMMIDGNYVFIPTLSVDGERATQVFYYANGKLESLRTFGRVERFSGYRGSVRIYAARSPRDPSLLMPLALKSATKLEDAKVETIELYQEGVLPLPEDLAATDPRSWGAWLVRWKNKGGDGWTVSKTTELIDYGNRAPDYRLTHYRLANVDGVIAVIGEGIDGKCYAIPYLDTVDTWLATGATCDEAVTGLVKLREKRRAEIIVENKQKEEARAQDAARAAAQEAAAAQDRAKKAEAARRLAGDPAEVKKRAEAAETTRVYNLWSSYESQASAGKTTEACTTGKQMPIEEHIKVVRRRVILRTFKETEITCVKDRKPTDAQMAELNRDLAFNKRMYGGGEEAPSSASWKPGDWHLSPSLPSVSHSEWMQRANDYTYGSGHASSCPFSASLCR